MTNYRIFAEATADFPDGLLETLDVTILPMTVEMGGNEYVIGTEGSIDPVEFYGHLSRGETARTAQVTTNTYYQYFEKELNAGNDIILISFSSGLSKSYEASVLCAEKLKGEFPDRKVYCIDSLCAAGGHGLLVYAAVRKQKLGMPVDELADWVEKNKMNMAHWVTVDELDTLLRGGRVSKTSATVGSLLNIKPIIHVDHEGKLIPVNKVRGRKKSLELMARMCRENADRAPDEVVFLGHGTDIEGANLLRDMIMADGGPQDVRLMYIGPVIGAHTGPTVITLFFFGDKR